MAAKSVISVMERVERSGEKPQEDQTADHEPDPGPVRPARALVQEHDTQGDRHDGVRRCGGGDHGGVRVPDPEVEGDVPEGVDDRDERDGGEELR